MMQNITIVLSCIKYNCVSCITILLEITTVLSCIKYNCITKYNNYKVVLNITILNVWLIITPVLNISALTV